MATLKFTAKQLKKNSFFNPNFVIGLGLFGAGSYWQWLNKINDQSTENQKKNNEARFFPWHYENNFKEWEYKLIELQGVFDEDRFLVRRQKNGQEGYLVFAPFLTAIDYTPIYQRNKTAKPIQTGIMVNLGWVPLEKKNEISKEPPVEAIEWTNDMFNQNSFFMRQRLAQVNDGEELPIYQIKGVLRRGEQQSFFNKKVNWEKDGNFNFIDLFFMSRLFRFQNLDSSSQAYIEFIADEADQESFPIPTTKETFQV